MKMILKLIPSRDSAKFEYRSFRALGPHNKKILQVTLNSFLYPRINKQSQGKQL